MTVTRRKFLQTAAATMLAASPVLRTLRAAEALRGGFPRGGADGCIFLWLGGGACHIDTFDPKRRGDGKKVPGSYYDPIDTALSGVQVCEHLRRTAPLLDRCILVRSLHHNVVDEHAAATNRLHVGRPPSGTTTYPSLGSVIAHELPPGGEGVPPYVLIGYPSASRGPGFLGAKCGYVYLTDTEVGPRGLKRPEGISEERQKRREELLAALQSEHQRRSGGDARIKDYAAASEAAFKLMGREFMEVFNLKSERDALRESYGGEFGQRCLLARRLVESGVRFVEVSFKLNFINGTGWDTHNEGQKNQHVLIQQLDQALSALIADLEARKRLDKTLVVVATEFGRPPEFDAGGGRGHHSAAFSAVLAGGGLKTGRVIGVTDELGKEPLERPVSVPDFHATIYAALGIDPLKELYDGDRPVPITDHGQEISEAFA